MPAPQSSDVRLESIQSTLPDTLRSEVRLWQGQLSSEHLWGRWAGLKGKAGRGCYRAPWRVSAGAKSKLSFPTCLWENFLNSLENSPGPLYARGYWSFPVLELRWVLKALVQTRKACVPGCPPRGTPWVWDWQYWRCIYASQASWSSSPCLLGCSLVSESGHPESNLLFLFPESENNSPQGCRRLCWEGKFGMKSVLATVQLFTWTAGHHCHHLLPLIFETLISSPTVHLM